MRPLQAVRVCAGLVVWLADELLDQLPSHEGGHWHRYGQWGCRMQLGRVWWPLLNEEPV